MSEDASRGLLQDLYRGLIKALASRQSRRATIHGDVAAARYTELGQYHQQFLVGFASLGAQLRGLEAAIAQGDNAQVERVGEVVSVVEALSAQRATGRSHRRALYEAARLSSQQFSVADVLMPLTRQEHVALESLMATIAAYFETNDVYEHEFARVLKMTHDLTRRWQLNRVDARDIASLLSFLGKAEDEIAARWAAVARAYAIVDASLRLKLAATHQRPPTDLRP